MADQLLENSVGWWKLVSSIDFTGSEFFKRCNKTFLENNLLVLKIDSLLALLFVFYKGNLLSTKDLNKINNPVSPKVGRKTLRSHFGTFSKFVRRY